MTLTDPIGDLITRMRNAQQGRRTDCRAPWSTLKQAICDLLAKQGYLESSVIEGEGVELESWTIFLEGHYCFALNSFALARLTDS